MVRDIRNIGPTTAKWLATAGLHTREEIVALGPVAAYKKVLEKYPHNVSFNCLFALYAGLQDRDWRSLSEDEKAQLRKQAGYT